MSAVCRAQDAERRIVDLGGGRREVGMVDYVGEERSPTFDLSSINTVPIDLGAGAIGKSGKVN